MGSCGLEGCADVFAVVEEGRVVQLLRVSQHFELPVREWHLTFDCALLQGHIVILSLRTSRAALLLPAMISSFTVLEKILLNWSQFSDQRRIVYISCNVAESLADMEKSPVKEGKVNESTRSVEMLYSFVD